MKLLYRLLHWRQVKGYKIIRVINLRIAIVEKGWQRYLIEPESPKWF